jgi:hypothetical protein
VIAAHTPLTLLDVVHAVCEASSSSEEAARVLAHLVSTGQVRLLSQPRRAARRDATRFVQNAAPILHPSRVRAREAALSRTAQWMGKCAALCNEYDGT